MPKDKPAFKKPAPSRPSISWTDTDEKEFMERLHHFDPGKLEEEGDFQIALTRFLVEKVAKAEKANSDAEAEYKVVYAETELKVRKSPGDYELEGKLTEGSIKATVLCDKNVQDAQQRIIDTAYRHAMWKGALLTADRRKWGIENRVKLLDLDYWSAPRRK